MSETSLHNIRHHNWRSIQRFAVFVFFLCLLTTSFAFYYEKVLIPFVIAVFLAYLMNPLVNFLEARKVNRAVAALLILVGISGLIVWVSIRLFPYLYEQLIGLIQQVPGLVDYFVKNAAKILRETLMSYGLKDTSVIDRAIGSINLIDQALARFQ